MRCSSFVLTCVELGTAAPAKVPNDSDAQGIGGHFADVDEPVTNVTRQLNAQLAMTASWMVVRLLVIGAAMDHVNDLDPLDELFNRDPGGQPGGPRRTGAAGGSARRSTTEQTSTNGEDGAQLYQQRSPDQIRVTCRRYIQAVTKTAGMNRSGLGSRTTTRA